MNEVHSNNYKRVGIFYANFLLDRSCAFLLEHFLTSQVTFSRFRTSFLSDFYCSHSKVKLVANKKTVCSNKMGLIAEWAVVLVRDREVNGSYPGVVKCFSIRLSFGINSSYPSRFLLNFVFPRSYRGLMFCDYLFTTFVIIHIFRIFSQFLPILLKLMLKLLMKGGNGGADSTSKNRRFVELFESIFWLKFLLFSKFSRFHHQWHEISFS